MSKFKLFVASLLLTASVLSVNIYLHRSTQTRITAPKLQAIADGVFFTSQLTPENVPFLKLHAIQTIVDIRPDGEASDQPSSSAIERASKANGLDFQYVPVPHESIPDGAVDALGNILSDRTAPTVLYCRTGRRAVRTFALAEASRADGPAADAIIAMVSVAGFSAEDLKENISRRIAHRNHPQTAKN